MEQQTKCTECADKEKANACKINKEEAKKIQCDKEKALKDKTIIKK